MKTTMNGVEIECNVEEFRELTKAKPQPVVIAGVRKIHRRRLRENSSKPWNKENEMFMLRQRIKGKSNSYISKHLGRTTASIAARIYLMKNGMIKTPMKIKDWNKI